MIVSTYENMFKLDFVLCVKVCIHPRSPTTSSWKKKEVEIKVFWRVLGWGGVLYVLFLLVRIEYLLYFFPLPSLIYIIIIFLLLKKKRYKVIINMESYNEFCSPQQL
jgi:hypothetical protein